MDKKARIRGKMSGPELGTCGIFFSRKCLFLLAHYYNTSSRINLIENAEMIHFHY